jgi:hypothetical protein
MYDDEHHLEQRLIFSDWSPKEFEGVPFQLVDPQGTLKRNAIMLYCARGVTPPQMPKSVSLPCKSPAQAIHLLSGVAGWAFPMFGTKGSHCLTVRLHYADGQNEDHTMLNGVQFADYIHHFDVPKSKFAFDLQGPQIRYLAIHPARTATIDSIEFIDGADETVPVVMAVTIQLPAGKLRASASIHLERNLSGHVAVANLRRSHRPRLPRWIAPPRPIDWSGHRFVDGIIRIVDAVGMLRFSP